MKLIVDMGYFSFRLAQSTNKWDTLEQLLNGDVYLCFDSQTSIRRQAHPWYKENRGDSLPTETLILQQLARNWQQEIIDRYPEYCYKKEGLEADDIVASLVEPGCMVMSADHDFLQLEHAYLVDYTFTNWDCSRIKQKTIELEQGERYLTYQLLKGCSTDRVPRAIFTKDRYTIPFVMQQSSPIRAALGLLTEGLARAHLDCLLMPTPLYTNEDSLKVVLERYP